MNLLSTIMMLKWNERYFCCVYCPFCALHIYVELEKTGVVILFYFNKSHNFSMFDVIEPVVIHSHTMFNHCDCFDLHSQTAWSNVSDPSCCMHLDDGFFLPFYEFIFQSTYTSRVQSEMSLIPLANWNESQTLACFDAALIVAVSVLLYGAFVVFSFCSLNLYGSHRNGSIGSPNIWVITVEWSVIMTTIFV